MYTVIGIERVDYNNKQGRRVTGWRLHCTYERKNVNGLATESFYVKDEVVDGHGIVIGSIVDPLYNRYGNVTELKVH